MFTIEQLEEIKKIAKSVKNQGELAVYKKLLFDIHGEDATPYSLMQWNVIKYCAEECKRQHSGEISVYDMINAWTFIYSLYESDNHKINLDLSYIEDIGKLVEPIDNKKGFRTIPIGVTDGMGGWIEKAKWERIPYLLETLIDSYYEGLLNPEDMWPGKDNRIRPVSVIGYHNLSRTAEDQFYYEYENIHPFRDGNGRSGKILYNYLKGTLENPVMPPNFWGGDNP